MSTGASADGGAARLERHGLERLGTHLESSYGVGVEGLVQLDLGVFKVALDEGTAWVARVHPADRPFEWARGDAQVLGRLAAEGFPAERCAVAEPVSVLEDQAVVVTEFVETVPRASRRETIRALGGMRYLGDQLGRLHTLEPPEREGGCWHHLGDGLPSLEVRLVWPMLQAAGALVDRRERAPFQALLDALDSVDACEGLPSAFIHPDFVLANVVAAPERLVFVDWSGAGCGPRLWSLAFCLYSAAAVDPRRVDLVLDTYRRHVELEDEELERLATVVPARPTVLAAWSFATGRRTLAAAAAEAAGARRLGGEVASRVRTMLGR